MENLETLNATNSFDAADALCLNLTTSPSLRGSISKGKSSFVDENNENLLNIIAANLYPNPFAVVKTDPEYEKEAVKEACTLSLSSHSSTTASLKDSYKHLKKKYLSSQQQKFDLEQELRALLTADRPCANCEYLTVQNTNTKQALQEAVQLSSILLDEVHRLSLDS